MTTWITSDTHYKHANIVRGISRWEGKRGTRPFNTQEEHDTSIVDNINSCVMPNDTLLHLGDVAFGDKSRNVMEFRNRINCKNVIVITGNHDRFDANQYVFGRENCYNYLRYRYNGKTIVLFHYPIESWDGMSHGDIHLFGHVHSCPARISGRSMDVGLDGNNFMPYNLDEVIAKLETNEPNKEGHHQ